jgi:hypothetical protein
MATEYVGNIIPSPGFWKGNDSYDPELLYSTARFTQKGVTLAAGQGVVDIGQVLAQRTTDKKWVKYNNSGSDGAGVARGIMRRGTDTGTDPNGREYQANIVIAGILKLPLVKGLDSAAIADLNGRSDDALDTFTF